MEIQERRKFLRRTVDAQARLVILTQPEGDIIEEGTAKVCNIGLGGALVSDITLPSRSLPLKPFQVVLFIQEGILEKVHMACSVSRINSNGKISLGLNIDKMPEKHCAILKEFIRIEKNPLDFIKDVC